MLKLKRFTSATKDIEVDGAVFTIRPAVRSVLLKARSQAKVGDTIDEFKLELALLKEILVSWRDVEFEGDIYECLVDSPYGDRLLTESVKFAEELSNQLESELKN